MIKAIDWQMVAFVAGSLVREYVAFNPLPKIYYWSMSGSNKAA
ncbi:hypothetical protein [Desertibacillus haloalkaliphilus]|nr:hypothetical protein [Desertibacillus haloalkaliphilus]